MNREQIIAMLHAEACSCVIANGHRIESFHERGVKDLHRLLHDDRALLDGAFIADKVVGKGAAALMVAGKVKGVYTDVISRPALALFSRSGIDVEYGTLVENIINKCMDKPWRSYILSVEDGSYIISGGASQGIVAGDKFTLYKKGKTVKNPQTGMNVELPGTKIGEVTVLISFGDTPETELSFCSYEGEAIDVENLNNYYIMDK